MEYGSLSSDSARKEVRYGYGKESYVFVIFAEEGTLKIGELGVVRIETNLPIGES